MPVSGPTLLPVVFLAQLRANTPDGGERAIARARPNEETERLLHLFKAAERAGVCQVVLRSSTSPAQVMNVFQRPDLQGRIAVLHLVGTEEDDQRYLYAKSRRFERAGRSFRSYLAAQQGLHLVNLSGRSVHFYAGDFLEAGVPAVMSLIDEQSGADYRWPALWFTEQFYRGLIGGATLAQSYQAALQERIALFGTQGALPLLQSRSDEAGSWRLGMADWPEIPWNVPFFPGGSFRGSLRSLGRLHKALTERGYVGLRGIISTGSNRYAGTSTASAIQYLQEYGPKYSGGVFWLDGTEWAREQDVHNAALRTVWDNAWSEQRLQTVAAYLKTHNNCLLVLDNVSEQEQIQTVLTTLLPPDGSCRLLVTTKGRDLPGLAMIDVEDVAIVRDPGALELQSIVRHIDSGRVEDDAPEAYAPLRLDAAVPHSVKVETSFYLAAAVRHPKSPQLDEEGLRNVKSGKAALHWRRNQKYVELILEVLANDCEVNPKRFPPFRLRRGADSPTFWFLLKAHKPGPVPIVVNLYYKDLTAGSAAVKTRASRARVGRVKLVTDSQAVELVRLPAPEQLTGAQIEQFLNALIGAYTREELTRMVQIHLEENLDAIAGGVNLSAVCLELITWATRRGVLPRLISAVHADRGNNPKIKAFILSLE